MLPELIMYSHCVVIFLIWEFCSFEEKLGVIQTPRILEAWEDGIRFIGIMSSW